MASNDSSGLNRRVALSTLAAAAVGVVVVASAGQATASPGSRSGALSASAVGLRVADFEVVRESTHLGAIVLDVASPRGDSFSVLVCAKGAERGVAETDAVALFLRNDGAGDTPTHELHGRVVMSLAELMRPLDAAYASRGLLTLSERLAKHGGAVGL